MSEQLSRLTAALADRYRVERPLGQGGMATVYLAHDLRHNRKVAVKVLRPELAAALGAERFLKEIEVTANLQHPHILPLFDSGEADTLLYYVMPYVEGQSLRERLDRQKRLSPSEVTRLAAQVASALDYAHRRGVIHRDIKPENVLLHEGEVMVADFGIALAVAQAGGTRLTETGVSLGTPSYMSPEQATGDQGLDARTDVYALGCVCYEMLAGAPPFASDTAQAVIARVLTEAPPNVCSIRAEVPRAMADAIAAALAKDRTDRFASAVELAQALEAAVSTDSPRRSRHARGILVAAALLGAVGVAFLGYRSYRDSADLRWARSVAIPGAERLLSEARTPQAFFLIQRAAQYLEEDPTLETLRELASVSITVVSEPPGARVFYRDYALADTGWRGLGMTPLEDVRVPDAHLRFRIEHEGYRALVLGMSTWERRLRVRLLPADAEDDVVWIPRGTYDFGAAPIALNGFRLDRHEVTNAQFQAFVDGGGYLDDSYWPKPLREGGRMVGWDSAVARFRDRTGRPGPAMWELSRFPEGQAEYPVGGVSWFEAVAYCAFVGKELPTYYHWKLAAGIETVDDVLALSNFGDEGPIPVGTSGSVGRYGTVDLAGNVREWVWNRTNGRRYVLGGAWSDPDYMYQQVDATDPWSRDAVNGFRCARYESAIADSLLGPVDQPYFDFNEVVPVDDATFAIYRRFYTYDSVSLDPQSVVLGSTRDWIKERVEFTAAYPGERVPAYVFLPTNTDPPYQTVIYFPSSGAFAMRSSMNVPEMARLRFIPRSGRALVYPVYKGTYERRLEDGGGGPAAQRQLRVWFAQDLQRTLDYVVARSDLRADALAYLGLSYGAEVAVPVALEKRLSALVLIGGAFDPAWRGRVPPEAAPWNFASRITTPTLLINGRNDFMHPYAEGQIPFFEAINVPEGDKRFVVLDAGHIPPWNEVIRHTLEWLDRRLGEVVPSRRTDAPRPTDSNDREHR